MSAAETKKRKRDPEPCRITYHAPGGRIFERLFKEGSLEETKATVRSKLGLPSQSAIHLTQIREGKAIELEDDDDFESFQILTKSVPAVEIRVTIGDRPSSGNLPESSAAGPIQHISGKATPKKRRKNKKPANPAPGVPRSLSHLPTPSLASDQGHENPFVVPEIPTLKPSAAPLSSPGPLDDSQRKKKKRKVDDTPVVQDQPAAGPSTATEEKTKKKRRKSEAAKVPVQAPPGDTGSAVAGPSSATAVPSTSAKPDAPIAFVRTDEEAARPKKRKRKSTVPIPEAPPTPSADVDGAPAPDVEESSVPKPKKKKKKDKAKGLEEEISPELGTSVPSHAEPEAVTSAQPVEDQPVLPKKKKKDKLKRVEEDVSPVPEPAPEPSRKKTKEKKSKKGEVEELPAPAPLQGEDLVASVTRRLALAICKDYGSRSAVSADVEGPTEVVPPRKGKKAWKKADANRTLLEVEDAAAPKHLKSKSRPSEVPEASATDPLTNGDIEEGGQISPSVVVDADEESQKPDDSSRKKRKAKGKVPCPICLGPHHLRFRCPTVRSGSEAVEKRLAELKQQNADQLLIQELETFLKRSCAKAAKHGDSHEPQSSSTTRHVPSGPHASNDLSSLLKPAVFPSVSSPSTPVVPPESVIDEVLVQVAGEGSSDESSDEEEESDDGEQGSPEPAPGLQFTEQSNLEALIRGPAFASQRRVADIIPSSSSDDEDEDEEQQPEDIALEEEEEEQRPPKRRRTGYRSDSSDEARAAVSDDEDGDIVPPVYMDGNNGVEQDDQTVPTTDEVPGSTSPLEPSPVTNKQDPAAEGSDEEGSEDEAGEPERVGEDASQVEETKSEVGRPPGPEASPMVIDANADGGNRVDSLHQASEGPLQDPEEELHPEADNSDEPAAPDTAPKQSVVNGSPGESMHDVAPTGDTGPDMTDGVENADPLEVDSAEEPGAAADHSVEEEGPSTMALSPQTPKGLKPITHYSAPPAPSSSLHPDDSVSVRESIEVAEDLPEERTPMKIADPIANENDDVERSPSPVHSTPKAGIAKRMKNRFGQVPFPVPEEVEEELQASRRPLPLEETNDLASQVPPAEESVMRRTRGAARKSVVAEPSVASSGKDEPPATQPKRRGRQPLSEEEKARRAAAKQAEKEEKARLRKEKQEQARAAKAAEKAEKALQRKKVAEAKSAATAAKRGQKSTVVQVMDDEPAADPADEDAERAEPTEEPGDAVIPETPPRNDERSLEEPQSLAQWEILEPGQSQSVILPSESSVDQLHPSSPEPEPSSNVGARGSKRAPQRQSLSSAGEADGVQEMVLNNGGESDDPKSARQSPPKEAAEDAAPETPLFLPTDSQAVIESPQREDRPAEVIPPSSPVQSDTEEEEDESGIPPPPKNALPASQPAPRPPVAPYRRLTDIASSQGSLFTPRLSLPPALARKPIEKGALSQLYADEEEEDSDSDDSDDDSEKEGKSHVPKNRRAGSGVTRRTSGLLAFA